MYVGSQLSYSNDKYECVDSLETGCARRVLVGFDHKFPNVVARGVRCFGAFIGDFPVKMEI